MATIYFAYYFVAFYILFYAYDIRSQAFGIAKSGLDWNRMKPNMITEKWRELMETFQLKNEKRSIYDENSGELTRVDNSNRNVHADFALITKNVSDSLHC